MILCEYDRATDQHAETAKELRNKRSSTCEVESVETNKVTLESVQEVGDANDVTSPEVQVVRNQEVKSKRSRRSRMKMSLNG